MSKTVKLLVAIPEKRVSWHHTLLVNLSSIPHLKIQIIEVNEVQRFSPGIGYRLHCLMDRFIPHNAPIRSKTASISEHFDHPDYLLNLCQHTLPSGYSFKTRRGSLAVLQANCSDQYYIPGYWEFSNEIFELGVTLIFKPHDGAENPRVLKSSTKTDQLSLRKNEANFTERATLLIDRFFADETSAIATVEADKDSADLPKKISTLRALKFQVKAISHNIYENLFLKDGWYIHIQDRTNPRKIDLIPPKDRFWADPFPIQVADKYYVFVEEWVHNEEHAHLAVICLNSNFKVDYTKTILKTGYHLSYPHVFQYQNEYYMVPETKENKSISLYKCDQFPDKWSTVQTLMDNVFAVDTTLFYYENRWWMFTNLDGKEDESAINDELYIFYSDTLFSSNWKPHARNPIKSGVVGSRSAGKIFENNGCLMRPAQDGSKRYGYGILIYKILVLSATEYEEELDQEIYPDEPNGIWRTHTYNTLEGLIVTDRFAFKSKY